MRAVAQRPANASLGSPADDEAVNSLRVHHLHTVGVSGSSPSPPTKSQPSAGIYNLIQPESAAELGARKVVNVLSTKADLLASANPGCTLQIQKILRERGQKLRAAHPIEILDASISGTRL